MAQYLTAHDDVRAWATARAGTPAFAATPNPTDSPGDQPPLLRLAFGQDIVNGDGGEGADRMDGLQSVGWEDWLAEFDRQNLALTVPGPEDNVDEAAYKLEKRA